MPGGGNFVVQAPQRQVTNVGSLGTEFTALGTGFFLEQQYRRVSRTYGLHDPTQSVDPSDGFTLASWQSVEGDTIDIPITRVRVRRSIGDRVELTGGYVFAHASLDEGRTRFRDATSTIPSANGPNHPHRPRQRLAHHAAGRPRRERAPDRHRHAPRRLPLRRANRER